MRRRELQASDTAQRRKAQERDRHPARKKRKPTSGRPEHAAAAPVPSKPFDGRAFFLKLLATLAVAAAMTLGATIFFKVQNVCISGNQKYSAETILEASGIEKGENLLTFGKARAVGKILAELPYIKQVQIGIKLPDTVNIDIVELQVAYEVQAEDGTWWLMDAQGKLLEPVEQAEAQERTRVLGIQARGPSAGVTISPAQEPEPDASAPTQAQTGSPSEKTTAALEILQALETSGHMGDVTKVDVSSLYDIQLWYGTKYQIMLGGPTELTYKIQYMTAAIAQLPDYQSGILDLSFQEDKVGNFIPWRDGE